jgi:hypothetical protein
MPKFECDIDSSLIINPLTLTDIVSSKNFLGGDWWRKVKHRLFNEPEVKKWFIPVDCSYWNIDVITIVEPLTVIPEHEHDEPVMRYVLEGTLELNGVTYGVGDWVIVPTNFRYKIQTRDGYKILSKYHESCRDCTWESLSKLPTGKLEA